MPSTPDFVNNYFWSELFLLVCLAIAAYLIQGSFSHWADSPFTSTVTKKKINSLDFPKVSVCLPRDLGIALSYDLMKTANMNITDQKKETLSAEASKIFVQNPASKIVQQMIEISNIENGETISKGQTELIIRIYGSVDVITDQS